MLSKYVAIFLWSFLGGVVAALCSFVVPGIVVVGVIGVGLASLGFIVCNFRKTIFCNVACVCIGLSLGIMVWINNIQTNEFAPLIGQQINMEGMVQGWPNITSSGAQSVTIQPDKFPQSLQASLRVPINFHPEDRVWIRGVIKQPENFSDFDYISFLQKNNVYAMLDKPRVIIIKPARGSKLEFLNQLRQWVIKRTTTILDKSSAGLVLGMLIGYGDSVPKNLATAFQKTGLTHILVASGFNLTIIASSIGFMAWVLGRRWSDIASMGIIWLFVLLTGSGGSVVRAGVMVSLILLARSVGRIPTSYFTLLLAVAVMVALNPMQLFYDIGFQLSVGATIGVLEANKLRVQLEKEGWLVELLWPTCGAIIFTAPIISFYFGTYSLIAPLANMLVLPAVPIVMLLGCLCLIPGVNLFTVPITELIVKFQEKTTIFLASWKYSSLPIKFNLFYMIGYYVILFLIRESYYFWTQKSVQKMDLKNTSNSVKLTKKSLTINEIYE